jgi:class 3 adenylate cyclase
MSTDSLTPHPIREAWHELVANSAQLPVAIGLYILACTDARWWSAAAIPVMVLAAVAQAIALSRARASNRFPSSACNLIAPLIVALAWSAWLRRWLPIEAVALHATVGMSVGIAQAVAALCRTKNGWDDTTGDSRATRVQKRYAWIHGCAIIGEDLARISAVPCLYLLAVRSPADTLPYLLHQPPNAFLISTCIGVGLILGLARLNDGHHLAQLRRLTARLTEVSTWSMGHTQVQAAINDQRSLIPVRRERAILFADVRGFTAWSERRNPEEVLALLSAFYAAAESSWHGVKPLKRKFTGDEVMLVFADPVMAARIALRLRDAVAPLLAQHKLGIGVGLHYGPLIEGLIGSREVRSFDVLGDTVNTGKRICDQAAPSEILCSFSIFQAAPDRIKVGNPQSAQAKGKSMPLVVAPLISVS